MPLRPPRKLSRGFSQTQSRGTAGTSVPTPMRRVACFRPCRGRWLVSLRSKVAAKVRLSPASPSCDPSQPGCQGWGMRVPFPTPTKIQAFGFFRFFTHASQLCVRFPAPCPPLTGLFWVSSPVPAHPTPGRWLQLPSHVTQPAFFLCSLAMRSSSWHGPSGRVRRRSRRGWHGCGGRSRRTWSWPSRSARLTCPPRQRQPSMCAGQDCRGGLSTGKASSLYIHPLAQRSHLTCDM